MLERSVSLMTNARRWEGATRNQSLADTLQIGSLIAA
jgi:hypothetical protein